MSQRLDWWDLPSGTEEVRGGSHPVTGCGRRHRVSHALHGFRSGVDQDGLFLGTKIFSRSTKRTSQFKLFPTEPSALWVPFTTASIVPREVGPETASGWVTIGMSNPYTGQDQSKGGSVSARIEGHDDLLLTPSVRIVYET